jgi:hypothetical protein
MAPKPETATAAALPRLNEAWIWPVTAAIVIGGSILFWCFVGFFWLATHPPRQPVVIRLTPADEPAIQRAIESSTIRD